MAERFEGSVRYTAPWHLSVGVVRRALKRPLPGEAAQFEMAPDRLPQHSLRPLEGRPPRQAGVLLMLYERNGTLYVPLTRRTETVANHRGQVSLPGGARAPGESLEQTARREAHEEIGVDDSLLEILGELTPLYIPPSDFFIQPFVAYHTGAPCFALDPREVAELLEVPLTYLADGRNRRIEWWTDPASGYRRRVPVFDVEGHLVWGATAMVLSEFLRLLEDEHAPPDGPSAQIAER